MGFLRAFIRRPVMTSVFVLLAVVIGIYSYSKLGIALLPKVDIPVVVVATRYSGAGPSEIETLVSKPIEDACSQVEGVDKIESYSLEGVSYVVVSFQYEIDISEANLDVSNRIKAISALLPEDADEPVVEKYDINAQPFMTLAVTSSLPPEFAYDIVEDKIQRRITQLQGLAKAEILGGLKREIQVHLDPSRLNQYGLTLLDVSRALEDNNFNDPSGHIAQGGRELSVRVVAEVDEPQQLGAVSIPLGEGQSIRVGDLGRIVDTTEERRGSARYDGQEAIFVECVATPNTNIVKLSRELRKVLEDAKRDLPEGFILLITDDDSDFIAGAVRNVFRDMGIGVVLTGLILFLFLRRFSVTLVVALTMPTAIVATFMLMFAADISMNVMSTLGLAISIGILVNNSILIIENIFRYREMGYDPMEAAEKGTGEIALSVLSTTFTNLGVFIPVAFMEGIVGQFLRDFALTVVFATLFALWVAMTFTPMTAARVRYGEPSRLSRFLTGWWEWLYEGFEELHEILVIRAVRHPWLTLLLFGVLFAGSVSLIPRLGVEFFPKADRGRVSIDMELPNVASLAYTESVTAKVESFAGTLPHVRAVEVLTGGRGSSSGVNNSRVRIFMDDEPDRPSTFEIADMVRPFLATLPDVTSSVSAAAHGGGGPGKAIQISVIGEEIGQLNSIADRVKEILRETDGVVDVDTNWRLGRVELQLAPKRWRLGQMELAVDDIANTVRGFITGKKGGVYRTGDTEYDIMVKLDPIRVDSIFKVPDLPVQTRKGFMPLRELADASYGTGPTSIYRKDRVRSVTVEADVTGRSVGEAFGDIRPGLAELELPRGYRFSYGGELEDIQENFRFLGIAFGMAIVLTFLMIAAIIESYIFALAIMLTVPLSLIGAVPMLLLTKTAISLYGLLGMIMLVGLVVNNAIVVVDYAERVRRMGHAPREAVIEACRIRLRPIVMADVTSIIAMTPLALGLGTGGPYRAPMALVVIGGLIAGGTLALFVIPPVYDRIWALREWHARRHEERLRKREAEES